MFLYSIAIREEREASAPTFSEEDSKPQAESVEGVVYTPALPTSSVVASNNTITNVTGQLGSSVFLPCKTHHSMERQVRV